MIPSSATPPRVMEDAYKDVARPAVVAPAEPSRFDSGAPDTAALARSLAQRMQETYPFAPSPVAQVYARPPALATATGSLRLDAIMNAADTGSGLSSEDTASPRRPSSPPRMSDRRYGNENHNHNSAAAIETMAPHVVESGKSSIAFILGDDHRSAQHARDDNDEHELDDEGDWGDASSDTSLDRRDLELRSSSVSPSSTAVRRGKAPAARRSSSASSAGRGQIKKSRICKFDGCTRYVVNRGLCIGHGGGKRCSVAGCTSSAKNLGVCWKHGGSTKCTIDGCDNRAKSRGVCWSHGGGKNCSDDGCTKTAVSHGLCWAHGGGKRCVVEGCKKPAYERNGNLCSLHQHSTGAAA